MILAALAALAGCAHMFPTVAEEVVNPESTSRKIVARQVRRWTTRPVSGFEKNFDFNKNGRLDPDELVRLRMARGYYQGYGNVWKYDKDKDWHLNQEEYYNATEGASDSERSF